MIVGEAYQFGFPPHGNVMLSPGPSEDPAEVFGMGRGSVTTSNYSDQGGEDMFGLGRDLPWENRSEVFGLFGMGSDDGHGDCSCPVLNVKNASMVVTGSLIAWFGVQGLSPMMQNIARLAGALVAGYGAFDIGKGIYKKLQKPSAAPVAASAPPKAAPVPAPESIPPGDTFEGLGSEWYRDVPRNEYLNRFASALRSKCPCAKNLGDCYSCFG